MCDDSSAAAQSIRSVMTVTLGRGCPPAGRVPKLDIDLRPLEEADADHSMGWTGGWTADCMAWVADFRY